jgi:hypothetical protein
VFAVIAAILFGLALLLDLFNTNLGAEDALNTSTLMVAGLLCVALHLVGVGAGWRWGARGNWRRRR